MAKAKAKRALPKPAVRGGKQMAAKPAGKTHPHTERPNAQMSRGRELDEYAKAMELFAARKYESAEPLFRQLEEATNIEIAHAARTRLLMCQQKRSG
ncbi:MAG: hypothetical protein ABL967_08560 [Bryobacteraceae bacterium]